MRGVGEVCERGENSLLVIKLKILIAVVIIFLQVLSHYMVAILVIVK